MQNPEISIVTAAYAANKLVELCHLPAKANGWWTDMQTGHDLTSTNYPKLSPKRNVGELLCLVHSEVSEAMEGHRKLLMDDKLPHRTMLEVELADAAIRIFDMAGGLGLDIGGAIMEKLAYNARREDHKIANRRNVGGKKF